VELDGVDLHREPIEVRRRRWPASLRKARDGVRLNEHIAHDCGLHACKDGAGGIVSKRLGSRYRQDARRTLLKCKNAEGRVRRLAPARLLCGRPAARRGSILRLCWRAPEFSCRGCLRDEPSRHQTCASLSLASFHAKVLYVIRCTQGFEHDLDRATSLAPALSAAAAGGPGPLRSVAARRPKTASPQPARARAHLKSTAGAADRTG
jgi:ATP-dependent DNA ligase